ncbi:hypothetical protein [Neobacillus sp. DY30]|uniref:hypothetical protein n=1 Tax=Neobacillus sp. DY30 TaxID=3047871 RepID=UPI0024BFDF6D|nr:hypothetical protein [Neobacillus sp. DY30]WHY01889.1 hypothetical protein QNH29_06570 [Neobacillus sp. DY30]
MKVQTVGSISEFLRKQEAEPFSAKVERHFKKYGMVYKVAGITIILLASGGSALASSGIEAGAEQLYSKLLSIGKWVIIFKGGFDIIKNMASGDFDSAKKGFISYLIVYVFLFGLPWAMNEVDSIFRELNTNEISTNG